MQIFIDSDACPVKIEAIKVATRYDLQITFVSNQSMRPAREPNVRQITVGSRFDEADDWIVENASASDIVVTADIKLAARCLENGCKVLNHNGALFTPQNIGNALSMRELNSYLREAGEIKGLNPSFSKKHRSQFLQSLDMVIQKGR